MRCPACKGHLIVVERESVEVDWCPACHGIWFDAGELEILAARAGRRLDPDGIGRVAAKAREAPRRCPRCRHKMSKVSLDGREPLLDRCPDHGLWFDAGELGTLMSRLSGRSGEEIAVVEFLGETFRHSPAVNQDSNQETGT